MDATRRLCIIDDHRPFAGSLKRALCGRFFSLPEGGQWHLDSHQIEIFPKEETDLPTLARKLRQEHVGIGLVIINANLKLTPQHRRIDRKGTELLKRLRAASEVEFPIVLLSCESPERLREKTDVGGILQEGPFCTLLQVPCALTGRNSLLSALQTALNDFNHVTRKQRRNLALRLTSQMLEEQFRSVRHGYDAVESAMRVFLGAVQAGDVEIETARQVMEQLRVKEIEWRRKQGKGEKDLPLLSEEVLRLIDDYWQAGGKAASFPTYCRAKQVLFVDDKGEESGWNLVLSAIFQPTQLLTAQNKAEALCHLATNAVDYVLLDYDFEGKPEGLEILQEIKALQFDVPVVMLTAFDQSETTKNCLIAGANDYFVKKLKDPGDRASLSYYQALCNLIEALPLYDDRNRWLWREFAQIEPKLDALDEWFRNQLSANANQQTQGGQDLEGTTDLLRKAYYYFSASPEDVRVKTLLVRQDASSGDEQTELHHAIYAEAVSNAYAAVERLLENEAQRLGTFSQAFQRAPLWKKLRVLRSHQVNKQDGGAPVSPEVWFINNLRNLDEIATNCIHALKPATLSEAQAWFEEGIRFLVGYLHALQQIIDVSVPDASVPRPRIISPISKSLLDTDSDKDLSQIITELAHKMRQRRQSQPRAVLIASDALRSEWERTLRTILEPLKCSLFVAASIKELTEPLNTVDFVLPDLDLTKEKGDPTPTGFSFLQRLKTEYFSLPVCIVTMQDESIWTRKCLRGGADDYVYFPILDKKPPEDFYRSFVVALGTLLEVHRNSPERQRWEDIVRFAQRIEDFEQAFEQCPQQVKEQLGDNYIMPLDETNGRRVARYIHEGLCHALRRAFFFLTLHHVPYDAMRVGRLLLRPRGTGNDGTFEDLAYQEVALNCSRLVEFILEVLGYAGDTEAGQSVRRKGPVTAAINESEFFVRRYRFLLPLANDLWNTRNDVLHPRHGKSVRLDRKSAAELIQKTATLAQGFVEKFPEWCRTQQ